MGNYTQYFVITYKGKESEKVYTYTYTYTYIHIHITESLHFTPEANMILQISYTPIIKTTIGVHYQYC